MANSETSMIEKLIGNIRHMIIYTPINIPVSKDAEFIADMEKLARLAYEIAHKYDLN